MYAVSPSASTPLSIHPQNGLARNAAIGAGVLVVHAAVLWAVQAGLHQRIEEPVVPVVVMAEVLKPPAPIAPAPVPPRKPPPPPAAPPQPAPPPPRKAPPPAPAPAVKRPAPAPAPRPVAEAAPAAPVVAPAPSPTPAPAAPPAPIPPKAAPTPAVPPAPPPPPRIDLPSSSADYLNNPKPAYPSMSRRMGEQGKVIVRVLIGADGVPQRAEIQQSSGFDRLDKAAYETVLRWRYTPGKRNGVAETMWFNVPINFVLE